MKEPYERVPDDFGMGWAYRKVSLTGKCKTVTGGGPYGKRDYVQVQRKLFGVPLYKAWVYKSDIYLFDRVKSLEYDCKCLETEE